MSRLLWGLTTLLGAIFVGYGVWLFYDRPPTNAYVRVIEVVDGGEIGVRLPNGNVNVRFIGIDAPEINHPRFGLEPGDPESAQTNRDVVLGKWVTLELDVEKIDRFGRLLAYV